MKLTEENFYLYAAQHYNNPCCCGVQDFEDDLSRFSSIKRLLNRYEKTGEMPERLVLNHIIILHNVFGKALLEMLFLKVEPKFWPQMKTFLVFLGYLPEHLRIFGTVEEVDIPLDAKIVTTLRQI